MNEYFQQFLSFKPRTELYKGSLFPNSGGENSPRFRLSERSVIQFFVATGGNIDQARSAVLAGLAKGTIIPSPRRHISDNAARAFLSAGGESDAQIAEFLARRRAYNRQRDQVVGGGNRLGSPAL